MEPKINIPEGYPFAGKQLIEVISPDLLQDRICLIGQEISKQYINKIPNPIARTGCINCVRILETALLSKRIVPNNMAAIIVSTIAKKEWWAFGIKSVLSIINIIINLDNK